MTTTAKVIEHYDALIDEGNDPVHDPEILRRYMDKWDGEEFISSLGLTKEKTALEIGIGTGRLAVRTAGRCKSLTGIDISEKTVLKAGENLKDFENVRLICGDFLTHGFTEKYDVIYSSLTFMHINEKEKAIKKAAALLNAGGRLVISLDKSREKYIECGERKIEIYPDEPDETAEFIIGAGLEILSRFETEFAYIIAAKKFF